jgi:hypothetical protein
MLGLSYSTDHAHALLHAARHMLDHVGTRSDGARLEGAIQRMDARIDEFGQALWDVPTEGWDVQDVLANIKPLHDAYQEACRDLASVIARVGG